MCFHTNYRTLADFRGQIPARHFRGMPTTRPSGSVEKTAMIGAHQVGHFRITWG
jgi:hypothetical protein